MERTEGLHARERLAGPRLRLIPELQVLQDPADDILLLQGYWQQIERYIRNHSEAQFTHGICPACEKKLYPELFD